MGTYTLIDSDSGYVWGDAQAHSIEESCRIVDAQNDEPHHFFSPPPRIFLLTPSSDGV